MKKKEFHGQETARFNVGGDIKKKMKEKKTKSVKNSRDVDDGLSDGIRERRILGVGIEQKKAKIKMKKKKIESKYTNVKK